MQRLIASDRASDRRREFTVDGWNVNVDSLPTLLERIVTQIKASSGSFMICTMNLDHLVKLRHDPEFRVAYKRALFVTADGFPIVSLGRLSGCSVERTTGSDLIEPICDLAARNGFPIFLIGSTFTTLCKSASRLSRGHPGLDILGVFAPPHNFDVNSSVADEIIQTLNGSGAKICFVALGAPRQEIFCAKALERSSGICFLPVGAGLDFIAGTQTRSPRVLQQLRTRVGLASCS